MSKMSKPLLGVALLSLLVFLLGIIVEGWKELLGPNDRYPGE